MASATATKPGNSRRSGSMKRANTLPYSAFDLRRRQIVAPGRAVLRHLCASALAHDLARREVRAADRNHRHDHDRRRHGQRDDAAASAASASAISIVPQTTAMYGIRKRP